MMGGYQSEEVPDGGTRSSQPAGAGAALKRVSQRGGEGDADAALTPQPAATPMTTAMTTPTWTSRFREATDISVLRDLQDSCRPTGRMAGDGATMLVAPDIVTVKTNIIEDRRVIRCAFVN
jgi:hypothetical protein